MTANPEGGAARAKSHAVERREGGDTKREAAMSDVLTVTIDLDPGREDCAHAWMESRISVYSPLSGVRADRVVADRRAGVRAMSAAEGAPREARDAEATFADAERPRAHRLEGDDARDLAAVESFYRDVSRRAEADMLAGKPITGAYHRALEATLSLWRQAYAKEAPARERSERDPAPRVVPQPTVGSPYAIGGIGRYGGGEADAEQSHRFEPTRPAQGGYGPMQHEPCGRCGVAYSDHAPREGDAEASAARPQEIVEKWSLALCDRCLGLTPLMRREVTAALAAARQEAEEARAEVVLHREARETNASELLKEMEETARLRAALGAAQQRIAELESRASKARADAPGDAP